MTGHEQRRQHDRRGLWWIDAFGGLRTAELGRLMWPNDAHARTRTDRVARGWLARGLVLARPLPYGAGRLLVLSEAGARFLRDEGIEACSGKDIGETRAGVWIAPSNWKHDLVTAGVLTTLYERGYEIQPERQVRKRNPSLIKFPDGLAWPPGRPNEAIWIEVENARKSGRNMREMANALCRVGDGNCPPLSGIKPIRALVAFVEKATDERRYQLDHRARVTAAIRRTATRDVTIFWATCTLLGSGVSELRIEEERIAAAPDEQMMKIINALDWEKDEETGVLSAQYRERCFYVWEDEHLGWFCQLNDRTAEYADSESDAVRGCARLLREEMGSVRRA